MEPAPRKPHQDRLPPPPSAADEEEDAAGDLVRLADVAAFLRRRARLMALTATGFTLVAVALMVAFHQPTYRAATLLVISDQPPSDGFRPPVLPVEGYVRLLNSRAVLRQATRLVADRGVALAGGAVSADRLTVRPIEVRRGELGTAAVLDLQAVASTGEEAAAVANACAAALIEVDAWAARRAALEKSRRELEDQRLKLHEREARLSERLQAARRQIADIPVLLTVRTRLGDAELLARGGETLDGPGTALVSQEPNPVYTQVAERLADLELDYQVVAPQLAEVGGALAAIEAALARFAAAEASAAGAGTPAEGGEAGAGASNPAVARAMAVGGALALLRPALVPARPVPSRLPLKVVLAAAAGGILALLVAAAREGWRGRT